jgi:organic radical activating enzyme
MQSVSSHMEVVTETKSTQAASPHPGNFCGGNYQDWLEVKLTSDCNGSCAWCIERDGYSPESGDSEVLCRAILSSGKQNVLLLGGEPTLYPDEDLRLLLQGLSGVNVFMTTNGSKLTPEYIKKTLVGLKGLNISIHHYDLTRNSKITGVELSDLLDATQALHGIGCKVRFNCNCIHQEIDSRAAIQKYLEFAKKSGADSVRFSELFGVEGEQFVSLAEVFSHTFELNDDPGTLGCTKSATIEGMPVTFKQVCGSNGRLVPEQKYTKMVLYANGELSQGWRKQTMNDKKLAAILKNVSCGKMTAEDAFKVLKAAMQEVGEGLPQREPSTTYCGVAVVGCGPEKSIEGLGKPWRAPCGEGVR